MIVTELYNGQGLGNQLWCYVVTRVIALDKGYEFGIQSPEKFKGSRFMKLDFGRAVTGGSGPEGGPPTTLPESITRYYAEKKITRPDGTDVRVYDNNLINVADNTKIDGIMQDELYIAHRKNEIRRWLYVEPVEFAKDECVINFRGREYTGNSGVFLSKKYWTDAIAHMRRINPHFTFIVITDDTLIAHAFFPDFPVYHDKNIEGDYRSINNAHYLILSNSSFAWFPAWLNTKLKYCIAPKYWAHHNVSDGYWACGYIGFADGLTQDSGNNLGQGLMEGLSKGFNENTQSGSHFDQGIGNVLKSIGSKFEEGGEGQKAREAWGNEVEAVGTHIGNAGHNAIARAGSAFQKNLALSACIIIIGAAFVTTAYYGIKILWEAVDRKIQKPRLLIESSSKKSSIKNWFSKAKKTEVAMALPSELRQKLDNIVRTTQAIKKKIKSRKKNVKYRNLLLWGPPGTGKSMFARKLAYESGMEFAAITGSSLSAFKNGTAITEIDNLFRWAKKSNKGLLIWIDEVDSLLGRRNDMRSDSEEYKLVNHILNYTGDRSNKFMLVMTTNHKDGLDDAIFDRIDDMIEMPLPSQEYREQVLSFHIKNLIFDPHISDTFFAKHAQEILTPEYIKHIAQQTNGLSNRNLSGIINKIITDADATEAGLITRIIVDNIVTEEVQKNSIVSKIAFNKQFIMSSPSMLPPHYQQYQPLAVA